MKMEHYTISESELRRYMGKKHVLLIDLRETADYMSGHLPGAVNIPFDRFDKHTGLLEDGSFQTVIFYCERGNLSLRMARDFRERGFHAMSLAGGMASYYGRLV